jgi:hypothetical protein
MKQRRRLPLMACPLYFFSHTSRCRVGRRLDEPRSGNFLSNCPWSSDDLHSCNHCRPAAETALGKWSVEKREIHSKTFLTLRYFFARRCVTLFACLLHTCEIRRRNIHYEGLRGGIRANASAYCFLVGKTLRNRQSIPAGCQRRVFLKKSPQAIPFTNLGRPRSAIHRSSAKEM